MIFLNFKTYKSGTSENGQKLAKLCRNYGSGGIIPVVQAVDIFQIRENLDIPLWVQSADGKKPFKNTGYITPYALKSAGAEGFFINHSDCPKPKLEINKLINMAEDLNLKTLLFASNKEKLLELDQLGADYLSLEDPSLIASDIAMVDKYEVLFKKLAKILKTPLVIGAGIRTKAHYQKALQLGAVGVVLSSQVMESTDPQKAINDLV